MNHLSEEELILHYYGDLDQADREWVEGHLAGCGSCQEAIAQLAGLLQLVETTPMPEARPGFEREVWARLEPQLGLRASGALRLRSLRLCLLRLCSGLLTRRPATHRRTWFPASRFALAGGVAALLVLAFVAGRFSGGTASTSGAGSQTTGSSERVLHAAVGDHLDRSQMMLVELVNGEADDLEVPTGEQSRAADLVSANRLFRQSAEQSGDTAIADILDDLERVLLEVANAPADITSGERADLKSRIQAEDLLFRVRVIASEMRQRTGSDRDADGPVRNPSRTF